MKIFITGGTGFVGTYLVSFLLEKGHHIITAGTSSGHSLDGRDRFKYISADTTQKGTWQDNIKYVDVVINLAGKNIFKLWTEKYKKQIYDSRILTTRNIVDAIPDSSNIIFCSTSAAGYYGSRNDEILNEDSQPGKDFLAKVCIDWENEALKAEAKGTRVAAMRFGVILGKNGGALAKMLPVFKMFAGGPLGSGVQWFPWMHIDDLVSAVLFIIENKNIKGPVNFCSPEPLRHRDFARALGSALKRPAFMPAPAFIVRLAAGELGSAFLSSQRTVPDKLIKNGFSFKYPEIKSALQDLTV